MSGDRVGSARAGAASVGYAAMLEQFHPTEAIELAQHAEAHGFSGVMAALAGILQATFVPDAEHQPKTFILLWVSAAAISLLVVAAEMILRTQRSKSQVQRQLTLLAVEQFVPTLVAGALVTYVFCDFLRPELPLLPGLWMLLFSLGVFASSRLLPRAVFAVGGFYLVAGIFTLMAAGRGLATRAPQPVSAGCVAQCCAGDVWRCYL